MLQWRKTDADKCCVDHRTIQDHFMDQSNKAISNLKNKT